MQVSHYPQNLPNNANMVYPQLIEAIKSTDTLVEGSMDSDVALIWSVLWSGKMSENKKVWDHYRNQGKPVIVIEVGGLVRNKTWKLGINGVNRDADFAVDTYEGSDRLVKLGLIKQPWKHTGEYVLVCGQHGDSQQWSNMPTMGEYYKQTVEKIRTITDKPIILRNHPRFNSFTYDKEWFQSQNCTWNVPKKLQQTYDSFDLESMLEHTYFTVSHSSNAGINSIIAGIPAVVSEHSLAYDVGSEMLEPLAKPGRSNWLRRMSYTEWFADEIQEQWKRIRGKL